MTPTKVECEHRCLFFACVEKLQLLLLVERTRTVSKTSKKLSALFTSDLMGHENYSGTIERLHFIVRHLLFDYRRSVIVIIRLRLLCASLPQTL